MPLKSGMPVGARTVAKDLEVEAKMRSLADDPQIHRRRVRVQAIGKLKLLPSSTLAAIGAAREATAGYNGMVLTIAAGFPSLAS